MNLDKTKIGHRKRLKERFMKNGQNAFSEHELLELLLTYSIAVKDVKPIAKLLLKRFGSLAAVLDAEISDLTKVEGVGESSAVLIKLIKGIRIFYNYEALAKTKIINSPGLVYDFIKEKLAGNKNETFLAIYLDSKNKIIEYEIITEGTVARATVYPRRLIRKSLDLNASGLVLAHNHPSGDINPSDDDIRFIQELKVLCEPIDIRLLDHIIVGKDRYYSFSEQKLI